MAVHGQLVDAAIWIGGYDLSGDTNSVTVEMTRAALECTTFGNKSVRRTKGLKDTSFSHQSYAGYENPDTHLWADLTASAANVITVSPTGTDGDRAYMFEAKRFTHTPLSGTVGELAVITGTAMGANGRDGAVRGTILLPKGEVDQTGEGTARELGAVAASQHVYVAYHVFAVSDTVTLQVRSAAASNMNDATVRASETITAAGAVWETRVPGAITDTWWDVNVSAITGTATVAVVVGIQ